MPTTPLLSAGSDDVRPPCLIAATTGVPSVNSDQCTAIPGTVPTLWEPATPCAGVPDTSLATVLPTPRTFPYCRTLDKHGHNPRTRYGP